jgi:hypothetical protein
VEVHALIAARPLHPGDRDVELRAGEVDEGIVRSRPDARGAVGGDGGPREPVACVSRLDDGADADLLAAFRFDSKSLGTGAAPPLDCPPLFFGAG